MENPLPALEPVRVANDVGLPFLIFGWFASSQTLAWFANVALVLGWVALLKWRWRGAMLFAIAAFCFAADLVRIADGTSPLGLYHQSYYLIEQLLPGFYLWLGSMVAFAVGTALAWTRMRNSLRDSQ